MSVILFRAALGITLAASLSACVPTTTAPTAAAPVAATPVVADASMYLATSDNGFAVPKVPVEKVPAEYQRQVVDYASTEAPGTVIISPGERHLYFITGNGKAIRYGIAVGKAGFEWSGVANVTNRRPWPTWTPPKEMIERKPELAKWEKGQPGGPTNPLGARALYLTTNGVDYGYRIHGTPDWWSIGKNASSGCIRMINQDVMDLYTRVPDGAKVVVLTRDGKVPSKLTLPPPAPKKKVTAPKPNPALAEGQDGAAPLAPAAVVAPSSAVNAMVPFAPLAPVITPAPAGDTPPVAVVAPAPATSTAATAETPAPACTVALVNGACPQN
jgi:lipoprotein-anchoring transpeptidase ErfK/SrfK